jgi:hypothetical protein
LSPAAGALPVRKIVNFPLDGEAGTAAFTDTLEVCCAVAITMLEVVTPSRLTLLEDVPGSIVTTPLRLNFALPVTRRASAPPLEAASTPAPPAAVASPKRREG